MKELEPIKFKRGVELLYAKLGTPVLPVLVNSGKFWGLGRSSKRGGTITVSYLPRSRLGCLPSCSLERPRRRWRQSD